MPIYDYICQSCGHVMEVVHGVYAAGPERCESCGSENVRKALSAPAIVFKGSGWAKKDARQKVGATQHTGGTEGDTAQDGDSKDRGRPTGEADTKADTKEKPAQPSSS
jgi:putative FmdB family regulatory protein